VRNFKYRIYPTKKQASSLNNNLEECRKLYNHFLNQKKESWEKNKKSINLYTQINSLPDLKKEFPNLKSVHSQVLQNVARRVDLAFYAFFRRVKKGDTPGYPRFKGKGRYQSITFPQYPCGVKFLENKLTISKIGDIYIEKHREILGKIKTVTLIKEKSNKWFVVFSTDYAISPIKQLNLENKIGLDVGIQSFIVDSNGERIENPRFFETEQKALEKVQRRFSKTLEVIRKNNFKDISKLVKDKHSVALVHEKIKNKRNDFHYKLCKQLTQKYNVIFVEDLNVNKMVNTFFNKQILDVAWASFLSKLEFKAEEAGVLVKKVNPAFTSQDCSGCGCRVEKKLSNRIHECPSCNLKIDRDWNAAKNILRLGLKSLDKT